MQNWTKEIIKGIIAFFVLNFVFVISLWLVWLLPDESIKIHLEQSISIINEEGAGWPFIFTHTAGSQLDNNTDCVMLLNTVTDRPENSPLQDAMSVHGYPRYWHGYLVFLRPLMLLMSYTQIRYVNMFLLMFLLVQNMFAMTERIGKGYAYALLFALCLAYFIVIPFSLQFSSVINLMLISNLFVLRKNRDSKELGIVTFLVIGMVTNFVDFLTAPLLTLGVPLITLLVLEEKDVTLEKVKIMLGASFAWGVGYFGAWLSKWAIGSMILRTNVFADALNQAAIRTQGNAMESVSFIRTIRNNLAALTPPFVKNFPNLVVLAGVFLIICCMILILFVDVKAVKKHWMMLAVCVYPILWYAVLTEHSQLHFIFTYRELVMSVYGFLSFLFLVAKKNFNRRNVENE